MGAYSPDQFRVLCIEDEPDILRDLAEELADHGFRVDQACSAEAALGRIAASMPDLVICDMQMPGMNGLQLLEHLRTHKDARALVPFVFLTAFSDRETVINGRKAGADDYLVKPVDYDLLIATVESHLSNAAQRAAAAKLSAGATGTASQRHELIERLASLTEDAALAVVKADSQTEVARRFPGNIDAVIARLSRVSRVETYRLNEHGWAVLGPDPAVLGKVIEPIVQLHLRDKTRKGLARTTLSAVSTPVSKSMPEAEADNMVTRLMESARLLQREGGGQLLDLDGPEMSDVRLASSIRAELITALRQGQLHVCFQPKVSAGSGAPLSAEVLVRWQSPMLGHLSPATFIPVVERAGLLSHLTDWVLRQAAIAQIQLTQDGLPPRLAVNIGGSEFTADLPDRIAAIFAEHGAREDLLEVEVTETSMMADPGQAESIVRALHDRGIAVALDDFGTGFSSLSHLQACPVDTIKIDRSFVQGVGEYGPDQKIVLGIIGLARSLGVETVAEGVELESQRRWLAAHECDTLQGYVISRPLRFEDYCALLRAWPKAA